MHRQLPRFNQLLRQLKKPLAILEILRLRLVMLPGLVKRLPDNRVAERILVFDVVTRVRGFEQVTDAAAGGGYGGAAD